MAEQLSILNIMTRAPSIKTPVSMILSLSFKLSRQTIGIAIPKTKTSVETSQVTMEIQSPVMLKHLSAGTWPHILGMGRHWKMVPKILPRPQQPFTTSAHQHRCWNHFWMKMRLFMRMMAVLKRVRVRGQKI